MQQLDGLQILLSQHIMVSQLFMHMERETLIQLIKTQSSSLTISMVWLVNRKQHTNRFMTQHLSKALTNPTEWEFPRFQKPRKSSCQRNLQVAKQFSLKPSKSKKKKQRKSLKKVKFRSKSQSLSWRSTVFRSTRKTSPKSKATSL